MKLLNTPASPYGRKVVACAIAREINGHIEHVLMRASLSPPELLRHNPLSKIPCLITDDGLALFDSPVICEYLDSVGDATPMVPQSAALRWHALKHQALGDGIIDATVLRRLELGRPAGQVQEPRVARAGAAISRSLDMLEAELPSSHEDIGSLTIGAALGYLDFRAPDEGWRHSRPNLAAWWQDFSTLPAMADSAPPQE
jgi:glutathione S-transferase